MTEHPRSNPDGRHEPATKERTRRSKQLFRAGLAGLAALLGYYAVTADAVDPFCVYQGLIIVALAATPALLWARKGANSLPTFEILMLTAASSYGLPLLNGRQDLEAFGADVVIRTGNAVILYQLVMLGTFLAVRGWPRTTPFFVESIFNKKVQRFIGYGLVLSTIYHFISIYYVGAISSDLNGILRAVFSGIGLVAIFVQATRWGEGMLAPVERAIFAGLLVAQVTMQFSTLFLVGGISALVLALVGYVSGSRRVPIAVLIPLIAVIGILHNGKSAMREVYWENDGTRHQIGPADLASFFTAWVEHGLSSDEESGDSALTKKLVDRTSLIQIICLIMSRTPERDPFLQGETYTQIPGQFVPRIFWPEKPLAHISTYTLSVYYGLQTEEGTRTTTIGFGILAEAYANFGYLGVALLGALIGAFYKKVRVATTYSPLLSYAGMFLVVLLAWSFQSEMTLSIWLTSMFQACVAVVGIPFVVRNMFAAD